MSGPGENPPLIERMKTLRPRRRFRRLGVQVLFTLLTLFLLAEAVGAILRLTGVPMPF